jgi:class 3 adenylate cyclase
MGVVARILLIREHTPARQAFPPHLNQSLLDVVSVAGKRNFEARDKCAEIAVGNPLGRSLVKRTGDGVLIEFKSVVDAVRCAIEVQNGMVERNAGASISRRGAKASKHRYAWLDSYLADQLSKKEM